MRNNRNKNNFFSLNNSLELSSLQRKRSREKVADTEGSAKRVQLDEEAVITQGREYVKNRLEALYKIDNDRFFSLCAKILTIMGNFFERNRIEVEPYSDDSFSLFLPNQYELILRRRSQALLVSEDFYRLAARLGNEEARLCLIKYIYSQNFFRSGYIFRERQGNSLPSYRLFLVYFKYWPSRACELWSKELGKRQETQELFYRLPADYEKSDVIRAAAQVMEDALFQILNFDITYSQNQEEDQEEQNKIQLLLNGLDTYLNNSLQEEANDDSIFNAIALAWQELDEGENSDTIQFQIT